MTDPDRISKRRTGLAAHLLQAGAAESPGDAGIERTLQALGVSTAILSTTTATSAAAGGAKVTGAATAGAGVGASGASVVAGAAGGTAKAMSGALLVKWIGIGVVSGVGLAGAAAVATAPSGAKQVVVTLSAPAPRVVVAAAPAASASAAQPSVVVAVPAPEPAPSVPAPAVRVSVPSSEPAAPEVDDAAPLAAEVSFVDQARSLLAAGQAEQGLSMLQSYERQFPQARLLPEVLFMRLETCERLGRGSEARAAAQRLVDAFPKSPHASRARKLLGQ